MMIFDYDSVSDAKTDPMRAVAYTTIRGLKHGYLCAKYIAQQGIEGVVVECGVANGAQIGMMARGFFESFEHREYHLFDSFNGIPMAGPHDAEQPGIGLPEHDVHAPLADRLVSSGVSVGKLDQVKANMALFGVRGKIHYHEGWFQDTLPHLVNFPPIALLRLDGDLYESTEVCLRHLHPLVVPGGLVVIDDYALTGCRKAVDEYMQEHHPDIRIHVEDVGGGSHIATWIV